ncbi:MAG: glycosyltransferase family 2 protein, partial [Planctomycetota bacterium]
MPSASQPSATWMPPPEQRQRGLGRWLERRYKSLRRRTTNYIRSWVWPARDRLAQRHNRRLWPSVAAQIDHPVHYSFLVVAGADDLADIQQTLQSLRAQINTHWDIILISPAALLRGLGEPWNNLVDQGHATWINADASSSLVKQLNTAFQAIRGEWFGILEAGDTLTEDATIWFQLSAVDHPDAVCFYSDEVRRTRHHLRPAFKPAYSSELLLNQPFTGQVTLFSTAAAKQFNDLPESSGFAPFNERFQDWSPYDFFLRLVERHSHRQIVHIPELLAIHQLDRVRTWQRNAASELRIEAMRAAIARRQLTAECHYDQPTGWPRIRFQSPQPPLVTIVIATRDHADYCRHCVSSLRAQTAYTNYEIVVIDNQSTEPALLEWLDEQTRLGILRVHRYPHPFNHSAMHNEVIMNLKSRYAVLLNNDVWGFSDGWLEELVATAEQESSIGIVGSQLIYPDDTIQHGGVVYTHRGPFHAHANTPRYELGLQERLHSLQELSAVTAALALLRCDVYQQVGGFDAEHLPTSYNDIDLCFKFRQAGYRCLYNPSVQAYHFESKSRGRSKLEWE